MSGAEARDARKASYRVDVSEAIRPGKNTLEARLADRWINPRDGDALPGAKTATNASPGLQGRPMMAV